MLKNDIKIKIKNRKILKGTKLPVTGIPVLIVRPGEKVVNVFDEDSFLVKRSDMDGLLGKNNKNMILDLRGEFTLGTPITFHLLNRFVRDFEAYRGGLPSKIILTPRDLAQLDGFFHVDRHMGFYMGIPVKACHPKKNGS